MTQGLKRFQCTGDLHFVTFSCFRLNAHLALASARTLFEETLEQTQNFYV